MQTSKAKAADKSKRAGDLLNISEVVMVGPSAVRRASLEVVTEVGETIEETLTKTFSMMGMANWPWTTIIDKAMVIGIIIILCQVVS